MVLLVFSLTSSLGMSFKETGLSVGNAVIMKVSSRIVSVHCFFNDSMQYYFFRLHAKTVAFHTLLLVSMVQRLSFLEEKVISSIRDISRHVLAYMALAQSSYQPKPILYILVNEEITSNLSFWSFTRTRFSLIFMIKKDCFFRDKISLNYGWRMTLDWLAGKYFSNDWEHTPSKIIWRQDFENVCL